MPALLKTNCPHCDRAVKLSDDLVGKRVRCPKCGRSFEVDSVEFAGSSASLDQTREATETLADDKPADGRRPTDSSLQNDLPALPKLGRLGRFELKEILGQGAYGRVYRAYDPQLDRDVALKVPMFGPHDTHKIQRFLAEAKAAARLRHPNIVPTYESGQVGDQYFIASQFVAGQSLAQRLRDDPPDFRLAAEWVRQLAEALAYAHRQGIVHRDIKPDNIMIDEQDQPQIMDFGLAKRVNDDAGMTTDGSILGTPAYMSPEQARGKLADVGPASDQYSLGVVLYEMLTGQKPFDGHPHAVMAAVIGREPPSVRSLRTSIPKDLEAICEKAMSKESQSRYANSLQTAEDLARWLRGEVTFARPITLPEQLIRWCKRNRAIAGMATATVLVTAVAFLLFHSPYGTRRPPRNLLSHRPTLRRTIVRKPRLRDEKR